MANQYTLARISSLSDGSGGYEVRDETGKVLSGFSAKTAKEATDLANKQYSTAFNYADLNTKGFLTSGVVSPEEVSAAMAAPPSYKLGDTAYYKSSVNGNDSYQAMPYGGNDPYGSTSITKDAYIKGLTDQLANFDKLLNSGEWKWTNSGGSIFGVNTKTGQNYVGLTPSQQAIDSLKKQLADVQSGAGIFANGYIDPGFSKFQRDAPTPSEQYYTPEFRATLAPEEQQRLNQLYGQNNPIVQTPGQSTIKLGNTFGTIPTGSPGQINMAQNGGTQNTAVNNGQPAPGGTPANSTGQPASPVSPATNPSGITLAQGNLQQGVNSAEVTALQKILGITQDGIFGPKTAAAVKAFQASHGLVADGIVGPKTLAELNKVSGTSNPAGTVASGVNQNSGQPGGQVQGETSTAPDAPTNKFNTETGAPNPNYQGADKIVPNIPGTKIPSTGNTSIDSLIQAFENQSPQKSFTDVYKEIYNSLGIGTMKADYEAQTKAYTDLQNEKNDKIQEINNNPWYSEGVRVRELARLDQKYEGKETILTNKLKLLETNMENARSDAQFVAGQVMDQTQQSQKLNQDIILKAIDIAEKQAIAEASAAKPIEVSAGATLYTPSGQKIVTAPKTTSTSTSSTATKAQNVTNFTQFLKTGKDAKGTVFGNPIGSDGYVDPGVYITAFQNWPGTPTEFLAKFPVKTWVNPLSYSKLPASIQPKAPTSGNNAIDPATGLPAWLFQ